MDPTIKAAWVEALRTGAHGPIGTLCHLAIRAEVVSVAECEGAEITRLPRSVRTWAGLDSVRPTLRVASGAVPISALRENFRYTVGEIADLIEAQL